MRFTYRSGQRPLEGYTLKRGVGQGGFGEVYFAVSDGGKEVALKLLRGHTDIELRGVANCLNLKHENLVHIYDLKTDEHGDTWLIMEYVLGESLAHVINRHPLGLPVNLAKEWFVSLARAVNFLHDQGVVHRDLKPANIFIENGKLKVGDYGLCKSLHSNQRQTRTVGTVHYMAPEVSTGNYNKQIDLYACGIILHEMLTGKLPFDGESDGEILMKHLTATPDLAKIPPTFRTIVGRALDKNPLKRYGSAMEMARAVEQAQLPTAHPAEVPIVPPSPPAPPAPPEESLPIAPVIAPVPPKAAAPAEPPQLPRAKPVPGPTWRDRLNDLSTAMVKAPFIIALLMIPYGFVTKHDDVATLGQVFLASSLLSWIVLIGTQGDSARTSNPWAKRLKLALLGAGAGLAVFWLEGWAFPPPGSESLPTGRGYLSGVYQVAPEVIDAAVRYLFYFGAVLGAGRWWKATARDRKERFSLFPLIAAGFWASILLFLWPWSSGSSPITGGLVPMLMTLVAVQVASPWSAPPPPPSKKLRFRPAY